MQTFVVVVIPSFTVKQVKQNVKNAQTPENNRGSFLFSWNIAQTFRNTYELQTEKREVNPMKQRSSICFRLRKIDSDLIEATANLDDSALSELARNGLRLMLGIQSAPTTQIVTRSIVPGVSQPKQQPQQAQAIDRKPQQTSTTGVQGRIGSSTPKTYNPRS